MNTPRATVHQYQRFRAAGYSAADSLRSARIVEAFAEREDETVRLRAVPEDEHPFSVYGEPEGYVNQYGRRVSPEEERRETECAIERDGCWRIVSERRCEACGAWELADSCGMFYGYQDPLDPVQNPYVVDLMASALEA